MPLNGYIIARGSWAGFNWEAIIGISREAIASINPTNAECCSVIVNCSTCPEDFSSCPEDGMMGISIFTWKALTSSAELHRTNPKDTDWATMLRTVGLNDISSEPMVECCHSD